VKIKRYKDFLENATADASSTSGMGAVTSAQPGSPAGTLGTEGSGDLGFVFKKEKRKKGDPTQVSDMRDLSPAKDITKLSEIKESLDSRDPKVNKQIEGLINDCLIELYDEHFQLNKIDYNKDEELEELFISVHSMVEKNWTGNLMIRDAFNQEETVGRRVSTLRPSPELTNNEEKINSIVDDASHRLINLLGYQNGIFDISWQVAGSSMSYNSTRNININVHITLTNEYEDS